MRKSSNEMRLFIKLLRRRLCLSPFHLSVWHPPSLLSLRLGGASQFDLETF